MTRQEIEHMWKIARDDPNFDTNWHDPVVVAFAKLVAQHEREACAKYVESLMIGDKPLTTVMGALGEAIRARGQA